MEGLMVNPSGHQLPAHNEGNSMMDRFLNYCDLPILGATALDQYLTNQPISSVHNQGIKKMIAENMSVFYKEHFFSCENLDFFVK